MSWEKLKETFTYKDVIYLYICDMCVDVIFTHNSHSIWYASLKTISTIINIVCVLCIYLLIHPTCCFCVLLFLYMLHCYTHENLVWIIWKIVAIQEEKESPQELQNRKQQKHTLEKQPNLASCMLERWWLFTLRFYFLNNSNNK